MLFAVTVLLEGFEIVRIKGTKLNLLVKLQTLKVADYAWFYIGLSAYAFKQLMKNGVCST